jgi:hypothetical protein
VRRRRATITSSVLGTVVLGAVALGAAACSSSPGAGTAAPTVHATKAAFCADNAKLDMASANATSASAFLSVLRKDTGVLDNFAANIPDTGIRPDAQKLVTAARAALATNNADNFASAPLVAAGASVDSYCGEQSDGTPLPADFALGRGTVFCSQETTVAAGLESASSAAAAVTFLKDHQAALTAFASDIPATVQTDAQTLVAAAQAAVADNDGTKIFTQAVASALNNVDLYCGVNH